MVSQTDFFAAAERKSPLEAAKGDFRSISRPLNISMKRTVSDGSSRHCADVEEQRQSSSKAKVSELLPGNYPAIRLYSSFQQGALVYGASVRVTCFVRLTFVCATIQSCIGSGSVPDCACVRGCMCASFRAGHQQSRTFGGSSVLGQPASASFFS